MPGGTSPDNAVTNTLVDDYGRHVIDFGSMPQPSYNPQLVGLLDGETRGHGDFTQIHELAAVRSNNGDVAQRPEGPHNALMMLRAEFPFLPIVPWPNDTKSLYLTANIPQDIKCPDQAKLMMISAKISNVNGEAPFFMTNRGSAEVPNLTNSNPQLGGDFAGASAQSGSFTPWPGCMYYIGNIKDFSVIAPTTGTIVTAMFFIPRGYGRNFSG